jgi:SAM-dependent methyltransferase
MTQLEIPARFQRSARGIRDRTDESARFLIRHVCESIGRADLGDVEVLDVGCGTKFSEAFLNGAIPIRRYVGVDVYEEMIEFLQGAVDDPRFEYFPLNVRNDLYRPDAPRMTVSTDLGVGARTFDLIWLFSVFTHLDPDDFRSMLCVLRRYVRDDGTLFFTAYLNERSDNEYGAVEALSRALEAAVAEGRELPPAVLEALHRGPGEIPRYVDLYPDEPLMAAVYSRDYAIELVEGAGWSIETILPPNEFAQHQFVCTPG